MGTIKAVAPHDHTDEVAEDGVYFAEGDDDLGIDVRKYARLVRELGLKPGEILSGEYLDQCRTE